MTFKIRIYIKYFPKYLYLKKKGIKYKLEIEDVIKYFKPN